MAVPAVTLDFPKPVRLGNSPMAVLAGSVNCTAYDTAHPAVTAITGHFRTSGKLRIVPEGLSSGGWLVQWDTASSSFKAYSALAQPATEATSTAAVGTFDFIAVGQI